MFLSHLFKRFKLIMSTVLSFRIGWNQISRRVQWALCLYTLSLVFVSGLDGLGLGTNTSEGGDGFALNH